MSILSVEDLVKSYGDKMLFDHISFSIEAKERIGLIGVNGTGKSTLLKVIAKIESVEGGEIVHPNQFRIEYLPQHPMFNDKLTVLEEIYFGDSPLMQVLRDYEHALSELELDPTNAKKQEQLLNMQQKMDEQNAWEANTTAKTVLTRLGITKFMTPVKALSGGQQKRVAIAKALIQPADLLILDEPTNHLDNETIEWLEGYLSQFSGALLVVTHDRYFLNRVTNRIIELEQGQIFSYNGNYEVFLEKKAEREEQQIVDDRKRESLLRRELAWLKRGAKARTTKQKARIQRVENLADVKGKTQVGDIDIAIGTSRLGKKVIELESISKTVDNKPLIKNFSYLITKNERLGIIGPNGSGKSTLLNILSGQINLDTGNMDVGETVKIGYYTQDYKDMNENLRVIEYIKEQAEVVKTVAGGFITAEQMLERFLFPRPMQWTYIRRLSGGERRRLYLLKILMGEPNVLFLDEPTNDLDTQTLTILEDYLEQFPGVVISVSHDRYFLDRVVDKLLVFEGNGLISQFHGNYSEYLDEINLKKEQELEYIRKTKVPPSASKAKERKRKLSYKEQKEWEEIENRISELENNNEEFKKQIEAAGSNIAEVQDLYYQQQKNELALEQAIERWTELSVIIEEIEENK